MPALSAREPDDFRQLLNGQINSDEYVRRLRERVRAQRHPTLDFGTDRCVCGLPVSEHINGQRCMRWFPMSNEVVPLADLLSDAAISAASTAITERSRELPGAPYAAGPFASAYARAALDAALRTAVADTEDR